MKALTTYKQMNCQLIYRRDSYSHHDALRVACDKCGRAGRNREQIKR
jgi:hypothetical protein